MKWILILFVFVTSICLSQKEASVWAISPNASLDFNTPAPQLFPNSTVADFFESNCSISDQNGNLLFYSDGETVFGGDNLVLPNGNDLTTSSSILIGTSTQGSLFVQQPNSNSIYYLFSLGGTGFDNYQRLFSYSVIDKNLNGGVGDVVSKQNSLTLDALTEKLTATKHCNNKDIWVVVLKYKVLKYKQSIPIDYTLELQSYLVTENGINSSPVKSEIKTIGAIGGQMKFNNAGNELAYAETDHLILFNFDKQTGKVSLKEQINLPLQNGYGVEYSPNDSIIYINEKQYNFQTNNLTTLLPYPIVTPLQRGLDGKIYAIFLPPTQITIFTDTELHPYTNGCSWQGNNDHNNYISVIDSPNNTGVACQLNLNVYTINDPTSFRNYLALPNFPSYVFNHKPSDFDYSGTCAGDVFNFFLSTNPTVDSVHWLFHDSNLEVVGLTAQYTFPISGEYQVTCTVYINGVAITTTQCVNVCGISDVTLPATIDLCFNEPFEINAVNTCSVNYQWNTGDTTSAIFIQSEGTYILQTTNACGVFYDTMEVVKSELCNALVEIPNVITSNGDLINDNFSIQLKNAKDINYSIMNRWGNLIIQNKITLQPSQYNYWNTLNLWDGQLMNGKSITDGTYFYRIDVTLLNDSIESKVGFIEVIH